ncbi:MAG: tyrosine-type recombinase/integrase [Terrimicrobiaceae bacterium]
MQSNDKQCEHRGQFTAARDSRNRRIPGLQVRNGKFYGYLLTENKTGKPAPRRFPLIKTEDGQPCTNLTDAKLALEILRGERRENKLPAPGRKPGFEDWKADYLALQSTVSKRARTQSKESEALGRWVSHLGGIRLDKIATPSIKGFIEKRLKGCELGGKKYSPASPRTVQLDVIVLRSCLKQAIEAGHLRELPRFPKIAVAPPPRRALVTIQEFERLLSACLATGEDGQPVTKNGEQLRDFLRFLAFCGCREKEALGVRWTHVDLKNRCLFIGAGEQFEAAAVTIGHGGTSKNRGSRVIDFNGQLEALMIEMKARRAPDSAWLFPSPQRGKKDRGAKSLRESMKLVRAHAKMPRVGFHDLRHLFCSFCVMAGIDFMTIAAWLGHKDGGILIGKVYGHLLDDHRQKMAAKLVIGNA